MKLLPTGKANLKSILRPGLENGVHSQPGPVKVSFQRGQDMLEFALIFPVLLVLVLGALDFVQIFFTAIVIANASREGARYATSYGIELVDHDNDYQTPEIIRLKNSGADIVNAVLQEAQNSGVTLAANDVVVECIPITILPSPYNYPVCGAGQPVRVTVTRGVNLILWSTYNVRRATEMMIPFRGNVP